MDDCCIIILNYKSFEDTCKLTLSLLETNSKIIIVDNNSPDNSFLKLNKRFKNYKNVILLKNEENKGYSHGNNQGMKYCIREFNPEYFIVANPDIIIDANFINNMKMHLENDPKLASVTGIMKSPNGHINYRAIAWKLPNGFDDIFLNSSLLTIIHNPVAYKIFKPKSELDNIQYVDCIPGSCFMIRSEVMEKIDFFDENYFLYCEERTLAKKIIDIGMKNGISLNSWFIHNHNDKKNLKDNLIHKFWLYKSRLYYNLHYTKNGLLISPLLILSSFLGLIETFLFSLFKKFKTQSKD